MQSLVDEILKMKDFSHPNILNLIGVALDSRNCPCIVTPFILNGSLYNYLKKESVREKMFLTEDDEDIDGVVSSQ